MALRVYDNKRVDSDPWVFDSVAGMRLGPDPTHRSIGILLGNASAFDASLNGIYSYDKDSVLADDGITVIKPTAVTGAGRWRQVTSGCAGWAGDPFVGDSFAARFRIGSTSSNYLQMASDVNLGYSFLPAGTAFTAGAFVWLNQDLASSDIMTRFGGGGNEQFVLGYDGSVNKFYFSVIDLAGNPSTTLYAPSAVNINEWHLIAVAFDPKNTKLRIWLDGVQANTAHATGMRNSGLGLMLGGRTGAGTVFDGKIESAWLDRGRVWSDAAMAVLYNGGIGVRYNRLTHFGLPVPTVYYEFEDGTNVGKNSQPDSAHDLANSNSADGLAGLVTLESGLPWS